MVWQTTIRNADKRLVAVVTQTQMVLPRKRLTLSLVHADAVHEHHVAAQPPRYGK